VFETELETLPETVSLKVELGATRVVSPPRHVPTALKQKLSGGLDLIEELETVAPINEPTPWDRSLAVAVKKSGALRIDFRPLNTALKRDRFQLPVPKNILPELSKARVFSTVDLKSGYWHCVVATEPNILTTFVTPL